MLDADAIPHCPSAAKRKANNHSSAASKSRHKSTSTPSTGIYGYITCPSWPDPPALAKLASAIRIHSIGMFLTNVSASCRYLNQLVDTF